ncbi:hypothetical protein D3C72_1857190 [compost metagenome]
MRGFSFHIFIKIIDWIDNCHPKIVFFFGQSLLSVSCNVSPFSVFANDLFERNILNRHNSSTQTRNRIAQFQIDFYETVFVENREFGLQIYRVAPSFPAFVIDGCEGFIGFIGHFYVCIFYDFKSFYKVVLLIISSVRANANCTTGF